MADIELVIKIDEDIAHGIKNGENDEPRNIVRGFQATIADAIKNGKPLDLEGLKSDMVAMLRFLWNDIENLDAPICDYASSDCISKWQVHEVIQQKINSIKAEI